MNNAIEEVLQYIRNKYPLLEISIEKVVDSSHVHIKGERLNIKCTLWNESFIPTCESDVIEEVKKQLEDAIIKQLSLEEILLNRKESCLNEIRSCGGSYGNYNDYYYGMINGINEALTVLKKKNT